MRKLHNSYAAGPTASPLTEQTISQAFDATVTHIPDNIGLVVVHQNIRWSYREYQQKINELAWALHGLGIGKGDRVGIWAPNCYEWALTQFASAKIGALLVCINPAYRVFELEYVLNKSGCKALVTADSFKASNYIAMLLDLAPELASCSPNELKAEKLPLLRTLVQTGKNELPGMLRFESLLKPLSESSLTQLNAISSTLSNEDPINIQFTSGTTGSPKGATLTHRNIVNNGRDVGRAMNFSSDDKLCIPVPLYHCFGMVMGNLACITHGATAVYPNDVFDPLLTLQAVQDEQCTALHGVPTMFIAQLDHPQFQQFNLSSLRTGMLAGAPCPIEMMKRVINDMHMSEVLIAYGQTECSPVNHMTAANDPIEKRVGSVGRPGPHLEIKIVDQEGITVPVGEKGEICCRGYAVMQGYWNDSERTVETIDNEGWLHSGDLGIMDADAYVQVVGRIKDMIIRGGENVYPAEIEQFLYTHPAIQEVQVFGVPDTKYGEEICAWIQVHEGHEVDAEAIKIFCKDKITHFKIPRYIKQVKEYPMTVTGKIQKFKMRDAMIEELAKTK
jgi:fatty-acyl-CoA synthase